MAAVRDWRLFWNGVLLCLPAVVIIAGISYFLYDKVPEIAANEHRRVVAEYRLVAEDIKNGEIAKKDLVVEKTKRPKTARKMKPGRWDYEPFGDKQLVWYAEGNRSRSVVVPTLNEFDYATLIYVLGGVFMVLFAAITAFGVRFFWKLARERDDFLAATAHDLATPLIGMRYALARDNESAKLLNERMLRIVENIKDFMRLGGKRRKPEMCEVDALAAYEEAYSVFREDYRDLFDGNDPEVVCEPCPEGGFKVFADPTMLVQILWNLLGNDLKYAAPYGKVKILFSRRNGCVRIEFADEGQGMTGRQMRKAFNRYYRSRTVLESGKGGFGIGLCTAREFALAMGGDLAVRPNVPKGCVFTLKLKAGKNA